MLEKLKKPLYLVGHLISVLFLYFSWLPIARVFFNHSTPMGVDASNFVYYINYFKNFPAFPVSGWKYQAFEGIPQLLDSTWFHFHLIQPFLKIFGLNSVVKLYPLAFLFLFLVFSYFLFFEISENILLSFALTVVLSKMGVVYIPLYGSGIYLSSISQTFFPLTLLFLIRYAKSEKIRNLYWAALSLALGMYSHPGTTTVVIFVPVVIFIIFYSGDKTRFFDIFKKIKSGTILFILTGLLAALAFLPHLWVKIFDSGHQWLRVNLISEPKTFTFLLNNIHYLLYIALGLGLFVGLIFIKKINRQFLPILIICLYFLIFLFGLYLGKNPLGGFMFPHRIYWAFVLSVLSLSAVLLSPKLILEHKIIKIAFGIILFLAIPVVLLTSIFTPLNKTLNGFLKKTDYEMTGTYNKVLDLNSELGNRFLLPLKVDLSFFDGGNDLWNRFYTIDYGQNLELSLITKMPQVRGGFHYSTANNMDWFAWSDAVLGEEEQAKKHIDPYIAEKQSLFIVDWYAIRYLYSWKAFPGEIANWFTKEDSPYIQNRISNGSEMFMRIKPEYQSPILKPSNAKVIGFVGERQGYDSFLRNLAVVGYDSRYVIPIHLAKYVEDLSTEDLRIIDGLFIYSFNQRNKSDHWESWMLIENYLKNGGVILVDTGSYSPEKYMEKLPSVFPMENIKSGDAGYSWNVSQKSDFFIDLDFIKLSPLTYEGKYWGVDYANNLREGSEVLLNISGKIIVAQKKVGSGKLIWSGLNMPYRMHYFEENSQAESQIFKTFMDKTYEIGLENTSDFSVERPRSEYLEINFNNARGVLFKENNYGGWLSNVSDSSKKNIGLKIYPAGVDFMYVRIPDNLQGNRKVVFEFKGKKENWVFFGFTVLGIIFFIDQIILKNNILKLILMPFKLMSKNYKNTLTSWWNKDEQN